MRNVMSWIKTLSINFVVLFVLIVFIEVMAGVLRMAIGKKYFFPNIFSSESYCTEMKTDVLLSHVHNHRSSCQIKGGFVDGEYIRYHVSDPTNPTILTIGGSTTDGFFQHISAGDTYPYYLADFLAEDYQIMNGGVGGYSSLQELYKIIRDAPRIDNLHTVISLNGINETPDYHGYNKTRKIEYPFLTFEQVQMNSQQTWIDQRQISYLPSLLPNLNSLIIYIGRNAPVESEESSLTLSDPIVIDSAERWLINVTRTHDVLQGQGVRYYVFLQPTMGLEGPQSSPEKDSTDERLFTLLTESYIEEIRILYSKLRRHCASLSYCFDISDQVPPTGNMYNDPRHHNSNGNRVLAQLIASILTAQDKVTP